MIEGTWYLPTDTMLINYLLVRGKDKNYPYTRIH